MAFMIPASLTNLRESTAGERKLFSLLRRILPDSCIVRYEMRIGERDFRPDLTLIDPTRGVLIVEVKDWGVERVTNATKDEFVIRGYQGKSAPKSQPNPDWKCRNYLRFTREPLISKPVLRDESGRLMVPVEYLLAFTNISDSEFIGRGWGSLISLDHALFKEDLSESGEPFWAHYNRLLPKLPTTMADNRVSAIVEALFPDIVIKATPRDEGKLLLGEESYSLDPEQERIAKSLGQGPRLLRGIAGTGKTLIMLYRAKLMAANAAAKATTRTEGILVLCWNKSLAHYMRQLYERLQIEVNGRQATIKNFTSFAIGLLSRSEDREFVKKLDDPEFRKRICDDPEFVKRLEAVPIGEHQKYDAIYIDEAQDFDREWIEFLFHRLLKGDDPKTRNLLLAADDAQRIYLKRNFSWKDLEEEDAPRLNQKGDFSWSKLGIPMQGRSKILKTVYRNSALVWTFASFLLGEEAAYSKEDKEEVRFSSKGGYDPELIPCQTQIAQINKAVEIIEQMARAGYAYRNVLILYRHRSSNRFGCD